MVGPSVRRPAIAERVEARGQHEHPRGRAGAGQRVGVPAERYRVTTAGIDVGLHGRAERQQALVLRRLAGKSLESRFEPRCRALVLLNITATALKKYEL